MNLRKKKLIPFSYVEIPSIEEIKTEEIVLEVEEFQHIKTAFEEIKEDSVKFYL